MNNSRVGRKIPNKEIYPFKQNPLSLMTIFTFFSTYGQPYFYQMFNEKLYLIKNVLMLRVRSMINLFLQIFNDFLIDKWENKSRIKYAKSSNKSHVLQVCLLGNLKSLTVSLNAICFSYVKHLFSQT